MQKTALNQNKNAKKLAFVLMASLSVISVGKKAILQLVLYICYLVYFKRLKSNIQVLINSKNEFNTINLTYTKKLGLHIRKTDVKAWIVIASFSLQDKLEKV